MWFGSDCISGLSHWPQYQRPIANLSAKEGAKEGMQSCGSNASAQTFLGLLYVILHDNETADAQILPLSSLLLLLPC